MTRIWRTLKQLHIWLSGSSSAVIIYYLWIIITVALAIYNIWCGGISLLILLASLLWSKEIQFHRVRASKSFKSKSIICPNKKYIVIESNPEEGVFQEITNNLDDDELFLIYRKLRKRYLKRRSV